MPTPCCGRGNFFDFKIENNASIYVHTISLYVPYMCIEMMMMKNLISVCVFFDSADADKGDVDRFNFDLARTIGTGKFYVYIVIMSMIESYCSKLP
jgi:hypothetical protein